LITRVKTVIVILIATLTIQSVYAQQYCFQQYSLIEGLPQSEVTSIIQSPQGTLWVGTDGGGISEFDGVKFTELDFNTEIEENSIIGLFKSSDNDIYFAGQRIYKTNGIETKTISNLKIKSNSNIKFAELRHSKEILILISNSNKSNLYIIKNDTLLDLSYLFPQFKNKNFTHIFADTISRKIYINGNKETYTYETNHIEKLDLGLTNIKTKPLVQILGKKGDTLLLVLKYKNKTELAKYKDKITEKISLKKDLTINTKEGFKVDAKGQIWLISSSGVGILNGKKFIEINKNKGLNVEKCNTLFIDKLKNIWIGTKGGGLLKYCGDELFRYTEKEGLKSSMVRSFLEIKDDNYLIGTEGGGISFLNIKNHKIKNYIQKNMSENKVYSFTYFKNKILAASANGILQFNGTKFVNISSQLKIGKLAIQYLFADGDSLWIGTQNNGLYYYYHRRIKKYTIKDNINSNHITHIYKDSRQRIWVSSYGGVNYIYRGKVYSLPDNTASQSIMSCTQDSKGQLWVASYSNGLFIYDEISKNLNKVNLTDSLKNKLIYSLAFDKKGKLWIGRQNGIFRYSISNNNTAQIERQWTENKVTLECNGNAIYLNKKGDKIWFGTIEGAIGITINGNAKQISKPEVFISDLKLFLNNINWIKEPYNKFYDSLIPWSKLPLKPQFPFNKNHITFEFKGLDFLDKYGLRYTWKLEDFDSKWSPKTEQNIISYSNLPPGKYNLKVKTVNRLGIWSELKTYPFSIIQPIWKKTIIQIITLSFFLFLITIIIVFRIRKLRKYKEDLEILVNLKTKEIMQQNAEILTQNKILESQKRKISNAIEKLKDSYSDLALLNEIGKDISSSLSHVTIINKVYNNLNTLMDASIFGIGLYNEQHETIEFISAKEKGQVLPPLEVSLEEDQKLAVQCFNTNKEIFINDFEKFYVKFGEKPTQLVTQQIPSSLFYVPLVVGNQKIGLITVQSYKKNAYEEYHLNLVRNLSIYTGIALINADMYLKLNEKKKNLETANNFVKEKNLQIEKQNEELKTLNEEKNKLIRIVAHDLRNPLTAGLTSLEVLLGSEKNISSHGRKHFEFLRSSLWRMNEMIQKILDVRAIEGKKNNMKVEELQATEIISNLIKEYKQHAHSKEIKVLHNKPPEAYKIFADKSYLTQIIDNLLSNAIKFSPKESEIYISEYLSDEDTLTISIKDQGQGFKKEELNELFKNFRTFSARPTGNEKSSGIGLSVVKKYIDQMDGKVWCESEFGKGTTFFIEFDLSK